MRTSHCSRGGVAAAAALALLLLAVSAGGGCGFFSNPAGEHRLTVLYFGDLHGHLLPPDTEPEGGDGKIASAGFARLTGLAKRIRQENRDAGIPTLLLVAGDCLLGTPVSTLFRGEAEFRALNLLEPDAMVLGNHEFDFGLPRLRELLDMADFPVLAANVITVDGGEPLARPFAVHYFDDYFVATIGTVAEDTASLTTPSNVSGLSFQPSLAATWETWNTLRYSADFCIALTHQGLARDRQLARALGGISLVVGGHDHLALEQPVFPRDDCPVVHGGSNGRYLGRLDLVFAKDSARDTPRIISCRNTLIPIDGTLPEDPETAELLAEYARLTDEAFGEPIGRLGAPLDGGRDIVRGGESGLGSLVADLMREAGGADAALLNAGAIRSSIGAGAVSLGDVISALPFNNRVVLITLSGRALEAALRHGIASSAASGSGSGGGAFLQVSGIRFSVEGTEPVGIEVAGKPLDREAEYLVAVNDFLADGGDGFGPWLGRGPEERYDTFFLVHDLLAEHIRRMDGMAAAPPAGRIR